MMPRARACKMSSAASTRLSAHLYASLRQLFGKSIPPHCRSSGIALASLQYISAQQQRVGIVRCAAGVSPIASAVRGCHRPRVTAAYGATLQPLSKKLRPASSAAPVQSERNTVLSPSLGRHTLSAAVR